jgi:hypothetical protein
VVLPSAYRFERIGKRASEVFQFAAERVADRFLDHGESDLVADNEAFHELARRLFGPFV